ncbi:hypothetical protein AB6A40_004088 [Gnathostoma spinigerum]|uniref:Uncharacterized protein n=1 Tax=Gnathostoma spinigerum TaxID=75299 RepID=A0ABD6EGV7_9BILA
MEDGEKFDYKLRLRRRLPKTELLEPATSKKNIGHEKVIIVSAEQTIGLASILRSENRNGKCEKLEEADGKHVRFSDHDTIVHDITPRSEKVPGVIAMPSSPEEDEQENVEHRKRTSKKRKKKREKRRNSFSCGKQKRIRLRPDVFEEHAKANFVYGIEPIPALSAMLNLTCSLDEGSSDVDDFLGCTDNENYSVGSGSPQKIFEVRTQIRTKLDLCVDRANLVNRSSNSFEKENIALSVHDSSHIRQNESGEVYSNDDDMLMERKQRRRSRCFRFAFANV